MSLATRCTACGTIFRVVEDQLRVSDGWVRCGRCQQVFNARSRLFDLERDAPPAWAAPPADPEPTAYADAAADRAADHAFDVPHEAPFGGAFDAPPVAPAAPTATAFDAAPHEPPAPSAPATDWPDPGYAAWDDTPTLVTTGNPGAAPTWTQSMRASSPAPAEAPVDHVAHDADAPEHTTGSFDTGSLPEPDDPPVYAEAEVDPLAQSLAHPQHEGRHADLLDAVPQAEPSWLEAAPLAASPLAEGHQASPSFVQAAERRAARNRPGVRRGYAVLAIVLLALLGAQATYHWRDDIAARWPAAEAPLAQACAAIGCRIDVPQRIEDVAIESSSLTRSASSAAADTLDLNVSLRNRGAGAVATPHIDLSLTDSNGVLIARRSLAVADFRAAPSTLPAGGDSTLRLTLATGGQRVAGYTVEAFYP